MSDPRSDAFESTVETLSSRLADHEELLLCTDFDGTLSPIVDDPDAAEILPESRAALEELHSHPSVTVAVVSGRKLADVRARVDLPSVTYAGNHGLELRTEGVTQVHPVAKEYQSDVSELYDALGDAFERERGVVVENKGQTLTVHHRNAPPAHAERVRERTARLVGQVGGETLTVRGDRQVVEVRPAVDWDKGSVVSTLERESASCLPVFLGDARTDESGFRAVERDGVGIRVGEPDERATAATEFLRSPAETAALLEWFRRTGVDRLAGRVETAAPARTPNSGDDRRPQSG
ncbi:trehalose 6-phosphate phosphatase [Halogeometricum limi]|uniref:Trehalose 6-phosphate phosphatase n=1 Tax=Halogeometricum limi TaxID=555875 RepID=A0A1I6FPN6_9EURY|nr:trehalose 6-phosphate phosphatase [Halogeometricum limi]